MAQARNGPAGSGTPGGPERRPVPEAAGSNFGARVVFWMKTMRVVSRHCRTDGGSIVHYRLIYSNRRTLALQITPDGELVVRAPRRTPERSVRDFVAAHKDWIARNLARQTQRRAAYPEPDDAGAARLRALAKKILPEKVERYARAMGVRPTRITITSAKTRFGSCSGKNAVCFSWRLMQYPDAAIDYVVVHELAHIVHHDHSAAFYAVVGQVLPDYKARQKLLRQ